MSEPSTRDLIDGVESIILRIIEKLRPKSVIIAGSLAKSKFVRGLSDIDILVVTSEEPKVEERFLLTAVDDVDVQLTAYSISEVIEGLNRGNPFVVDAVEHGLEVYGELMGELKRMLMRLKGQA